MVAGSWDGGVTSAPVSEPATVATFLPPSYLTTQDASGSGAANITSSPCYIPAGFAGIGTTNGDGAVMFGISGITNPWLVAMDPGNGNYKTFGGGPYNSQVLAAGISSPCVWYNNYLYVVDNAGNLYCFDPNANLVKAQYFYAPNRQRHIKHRRGKWRLHLRHGKQPYKTRCL